MKYITDLPAVQDMAFCLGKEGCLFITLCAIAERITHKPIDVLRSARELIDLKLLDYVEDYPSQHLKEAFYVKDRDAILSHLTGIKGITTIKTRRLSKNEKRPYYMRYATNTSPIKTHFVLPDYSSLYHSLTVENGSIDYYYIVVVPTIKEK